MQLTPRPVVNAPAATRPPHEHSAGILDLVLRHADRTPRAPAVLSDGHALTYAELRAAARALAVRLLEHGARPGDAVGLLLHRSVGTVVAQLAVWSVGCHYVPLDPAQPGTRTAGMAADAGVRLLIGDERLLADAQLDHPAIVLTAGRPASSGADGGELPPVPVLPYDPDSVATVMYTSGSTGRPKGVAVSHRAVAGLVTAPEYVTVKARDRVLFHSPPAFDAATFEVWAPLVHGAASVVVTQARPTLEELARTVETFGVTRAFVSTGLFHQLAARESRIFGALRTVLVGGDTLSPAHAAAVLRLAPRLELVHVYGPTEATTFATAHRVAPGDCEGSVPIGRPVNGATAHVLDTAGHPVPAGTRGELWLGGPRLAQGYVGRPEETTEKFVTHSQHGRLYRTGDVVSVRADGTLSFHGRVDDQVKIRGFRVEPGEVEQALRGHQAVSDAVVVVGRPDTGLEPYLLACVVTSADRPVTERALSAHLSDILPEFMIPERWRMLDELPLNGVGKVDRASLVPTARTGAEAPAAAAPKPRLSPLQEIVARMWSDALGTEVTSPDDDFLGLGGHSLLALGIVDGLRHELAVHISLVDFFDHPTVAGHAGLVERALAEADSASGPLRATPDRR